MNKAKKKYVSKKCAKCGKILLLGSNGYWSDTLAGYVHDKCGNTTRDKRGNLKHMGIR